MDAFESVVATLVAREGFWVRSSYKVKLTKEDKVAIGRRSCPRWELDLVAYRPASNEIRVIECKSYLDSRGVQARDILEPPPEKPNRYKLFTEATLRKIVFDRLKEEITLAHGLDRSPTITLALAAAKFRNSQDREKIRKHFLSFSGDQYSLVLLDDDWLRKELKRLSTEPYENDVVAIVSKILLR